MYGEREESTLQTSDLIQEAYLRLVNQHTAQWASRTHFFAIASTMMRRILVDNARRRRFAKRGGNRVTVPLDQATQVAVGDRPDLIALDQALKELAGVDDQAWRIVEMRFFGGLSNSEIAAVLGVSVPTITRRWRMARAWLYDYLGHRGANEA
jgi:RNA polymerase sigma factor (TIGR02999 family)